MPSWRYCYPNCGSHSLRPRTRLGGYRCEVCETVVEHRYDKKIRITNTMTNTTDTTPTDAGDVEHVEGGYQPGEWDEYQPANALETTRRREDP